MSRQRIRSSVLESSTEKCPHCGGTGHVRSVASVALQLLRSLEEMLLKGATHNLTVRTRSEIALYLLNHKRAHLRALEERFRIAIVVNADSAIGGQVTFLIERGEQVHSLEQAKALAAQAPAAAPVDQEDEESFEDEDEAAEFEDIAALPSDEAALALAPHGQHHDDGQVQAEGQEQGQGRKRRRRRRGRRGGEARDDGAIQREPSAAASSPEPPSDATADEHDAGGELIEPTAADAGGAAGAELTAESNGESERRRRRRGRRGGRRNRREREGDVSPPEIDVPEPELAGATSDLDAVPASVHDTQPPQAVTEARTDLPANDGARAQGEEHASQAAETSLSAAMTTEPARRRSTVREPALAALHDQAAEPAPSHAASPAAAEPVVSSSAESDTADRPRRSGWWSKRVLGRH
jgi:ribonuclease E